MARYLSRFVIYISTLFRLVFFFRKYKRRSFGRIIALAYFIISITLFLFSTLESQLYEYWGKTFTGSGVIVNSDSYDAFNPPKLSELFCEDSLKDITVLNPDFYFSKRLKISCMIQGYSKLKENSTKNLVLIGIDPAEELTIIKNVNVVEGRIIEKENEICLYRSLAYNLGFEVGDTLIVFAQTVDDYTNYDLLEIVGLIESKDIQQFYGAEYIAYADINFVRILKDLKQNYITEVAFENPSGEYAVPTLPSDMNLFIVDYKNVSSISALINLILGFILVFIIVLLFFIIFASVYFNINLVVIEKYREMGIYLTYGISRGSLLSIWLSDISLSTFYYSLIGLIFSILFCLFINFIHIDAISEELEMFIASNVFVINYNWSDSIISFVIIWLTVLIASLKPLLAGVNEESINSLFRR